MSATSPTILSELLPLLMMGDARARAERELELIDAAELPQPQRRLLDHDKDMTGTLAAHFGQELDLEALELVPGEGQLSRRVRLVTRQGRRIVEFGTIRIHLGPFVERAREQILAAQLPLGRILQEHRMPFRSSPRAFLRLGQPGPLRASFGIEHGDVLYGRYNRLHDGSGQLLAEAVEFLPKLPDREPA